MGEGGELGPGEIGEIQVQGIPGVSLMAGYWQQPEVTAKTLAGNWLRTGDYGYFDEEGGSTSPTGTVTSSNARGKHLLR